MKTILSYHESRRKEIYEYRRSEESLMMDRKAINAISSRFSLELIGKKNNKFVFDYKVLEYKQGSNKGLYGWVNDLHSLTDHLRLEISTDGYIYRVINQRDIYEKWKKDIRKETLKQHKKEEHADNMIYKLDKLLKDESAFAESLIYAPPFSMLFSGLQSLSFENNQSDKRKTRILGFGSIPYLPIVLKDKLSEVNAGYEVNSEGEIDTKNFDQDKFTRFVRTLRGKPTAVGNISTQHTERYLFDDKGWILQAMWLHLSVVPAFMMREERCFLKRIEL